MPASTKKTLSQLREEQNQATTEYMDNVVALRPLQADMDRLNAELERMKADVERKQREYDAASKKAHKVAAKISMCTHINNSIVRAIEDVEKEEALKLSLKTEKAQAALARKNMKKGVYSEPILAKVNKLPEELVKHIGTYLPYETLNELLSQDLKRCVIRIGDRRMLLRFIQEITTRPKYLTLLPREEARSKVRFLSNGDANPEYNWSSYWLHDFKKLKTVIYDTLVLAKAGNPEFAHSVLKTVAVLNSRKWKVNKYAIAVNLTEDDLPAEYQV
jgi:hypothetical protein